MEVKTPWGEIGYPVFKRTYARRLVENNVNSPTEEFPQTVDRVVNACNTQLGVGFTESEQERFKEILLSLKGIVAGRFLWQLGTKTVDNLGLLSLQNCAFVVVNKPVRPFTWAFDSLMLGAGVGFNIQKHNVYEIPALHKNQVTVTRLDTRDADFIVPDNREGWVALLAKVLKAHFYSGKGFTYSTTLIRGKGAPIKGFGGTASGPEELCWGIAEISKLLNSRAGQKLRPIDALDIMNIIGSIVVAGNVRRSAEIAIGDADDVEYLQAKRWDLGAIPNWRANSNNSVDTDNLDKLHPLFWETYEQGEPYGLINLNASRKQGRLGEYQYQDIDIQGFNPCFTADTQILTPSGYVRIGDNVGELDLINRFGEVVSGSIWSNGIKEVIQITTSQGQKIKCTSDHRFMLSTGKEEVAQELLYQRLMPFYTINREVNEYTRYGFIQGDGTLGRLSSESHKGLEVNFGDKDDDILDLFKVQKEEGKRSYYLNGYNEVLQALGFSREQLPNRLLPESYNIWTSKNKLMFLKGMYSANGSIIKDARIAYKTTCYKLARQLQQALIEFNIQSYITTNKEKEVQFSNGNYTCKESYDINISKYSSVLLFAELIGFVHSYKSLSLENLILAKAPKVINIKNIEEEEVFDFNLQDDTHWGVIEGVIAHNCAEQGLANYETCCLSEIFLPNITSQEELTEVATYLYRVCKHSLALKCHLKETEDIVHKNMRMGIGVTGTFQASEEQRSWLSNTYDALRAFDVEYSRLNGWPISIKLSTSKPSGTLSLLAGVTPGANTNPAGPYYYRRVRMAADSPLLKQYEKNGYPVEWRRNFDGSNDYTTKVVTFPCSVPETTPIAATTSAIQQLENIKWVQTNWSDNAVSVTVTYKREELEDIKEWLRENYTDNVKTVSFLLYQGHGFDQAPYETITREQYEELVSKVIPITEGVDVAEKDMDAMQECESGACAIK